MPSRPGNSGDRAVDLADLLAALGAVAEQVDRQRVDLLLAS